MAIVDSGASSIFLTPDAPKVNVNPVGSSIKVGPAEGPPIILSVTYNLALPSLPSNFPTKGHVMEGFHENLIGIGHICDAKYTAIFNEDNVTVISPTGTLVLTGWCKSPGNKLWRMSLLPDADVVETHMDAPSVSK
jgi:hypothetical protein